MPMLSLTSRSPSSTHSPTGCSRPTRGQAFPAHQFIISGTSAPTAASNLFAAENMTNPGTAGCAPHARQLVALIDPTGNESSSMYPCFEHPTLTDLLDAANITWRYYAPSAGSIWTAPNAIQHMCGPNATLPNATQCVGSDWTGPSPKVVLNQTQSNAQILSDIANGQLAQVSWVIPDGADSDHASINDGCGPSWVTSIVNAIGNSQYWSNTAIVITWDDWGGWYDHVAPTVVNNGTSWGSGYVYGFRVPMIVISPYAKQAYISHVTHDFGSILKFIESIFSLPSLGYADALADNLSDFFNLSQTPTKFQTIPAPPNDATCKSDASPPTVGRWTRVALACSVIRRRRDGSELCCGLAKAEKVGEIVGGKVGVAQRRQIKGLLNKLQNTPKVMRDMGDISRLGVGRDHNHRHPESINVTGSPTATVVDHSGWDVIVPASPVIPSNKDRGVRPVRTVADALTIEVTQDGPHPLLMAA